MPARLGLLSLVMAVNLVASAVARPGEPAIVGTLDSITVQSIVQFVADRTGYPRILGVPALQVVDSATFDRAVGATVPDAEMAPWAAYMPGRHLILLHVDLDLRTAVGRSYLVHELVHTHQFAAGAHQGAPCPGVLEGEAYRVQARYLEAHGLEEQAFEVELLGLLQAACGQFYR